ncbi:MAG TPA: hypothetical protein VM890_08795, partial [Longimicrobium sp.]|nr:hypothetical protein [Longimicrobium sp.]
MSVAAVPAAQRRGERGEGLHRVVHQRGEIGGGLLQPHRAALGAREVQHVVHQVGQPPRLLVDDLYAARPLLLAAHPAQPQRLGEHADLRQRR